MVLKANKVVILFLKICISLGLLYLVLSRTGLDQIFSVLSTISPTAFLSAIALFLFAQFISTLRWKLLLPGGINIPKLFSLYMIGSFFNTFLPGLVGGDAVKGLYLLLDTGHALISREEPAEAVRMAGLRLGYVQMNDNDGKKDRHWAPLDGRLTERDIARMIAALEEVGYAGTLGLELENLHPSLISALDRNRNLLMRLQSPVEIKSLNEPKERRKQ